MTTITFDTDRLVEAQTELATKLDLVQLEQRLIIKLGALMAFAIGIVAVLVKLL